MAEFIREFESRVRSHATATAYIKDGEHITFEAVNCIANQLAHWLCEQWPDNEVIGLCTEASLETAGLLLGMLKAGKVFLGLDPSYPAEQLRFMIAAANCSLVIADGAIDADQLGTGRLLCVADVLNVIRDQPTNNPSMSEGCDLPAYATFTSGSSGNPKAVLAPVRQIDNRFRWMWNAYPLENEEVCCQQMPLSFVDVIWEILGPPCVGIPVVLIPRRCRVSPEALCQTLRDHHVSRVWMLPAAINAMVERFPDLMERLPALRFWVSTGDVLSPGLVAKFQKAVPNARLFNLYGTSEVWDATWYGVPEGGIEGLVVPIGEPIMNVDVCLVNEGQKVAGTSTGEIAVSGEGLALGYWKMPERRLEPFTVEVAGVQNKCYLTGDLGRYGSDGNLYFLGRRETTAMRGGEFVRLLEIEAALTLHPLVQEGAVTFGRNESSEVVISGYYCSRASKSASANDLKAFLRDILPASSQPDRLVRISEFPMTPSGKIYRRKLADWEATHAY